jgi:hypothetical protein
MITIEEIRKDPENQDWFHIIWHNILSEDFIKEFQSYLDFGIVNQRQSLSEEILSYLFDNNCCVRSAARYQRLSEKFIKKYHTHLMWQHIVVYQKLSEDFLREYQDYFDWEDIAYYQVLSEKFILEFFDRLITRDLFRFQRLSKEFILYLLDNNLVPSFYEPGSGLLNFNNKPLIDPDFFEELKQLQNTFL